MKLILTHCPVWYTTVLEFHFQIWFINAFSLVLDRSSEGSKQTIFILAYILFDGCQTSFPSKHKLLLCNLFFFTYSTTAMFATQMSLMSPLINQISFRIYISALSSACVNTTTFLNSFVSLSSSSSALAGICVF